MTMTCTTTGLDNSIELWTEKIRQAVTEIWLLQVWQPPARPHDCPPGPWRQYLSSQEGWGVKNYLVNAREKERDINFIGLFENRGHRGPYSPYKPFNHNLHIGIIIFPHIDNPQYTGYDLPKKKPNKIINAKKVRAPLIWQIIGEKDSGSVYMWI